MTSEELKTLKDIKNHFIDDSPECSRAQFEKILKQQAIKWDKQDRADLLAGKKLTALDIINRWFIRLDLTEEDLK